MIAKEKWPDKIYLCVYPSRSAQMNALDAGAIFDEKKQKYYVHKDFNNPDLTPFLPIAYIPQAKPVLMPEMLPNTSWGINLRNLISEEKWDRIRKEAYREAGFICRYCGVEERLEAHEIWELHNESTIQELVDVVALCETCHKAHHIGLARRMNILDAVKRKILLLNNWNEGQFKSAMNDLMEISNIRNEWEWDVDVKSFILKKILLFSDQINR